MIIALDIDGVLCPEGWQSGYKNAPVLPGALYKVRQKIKEGNFILYYTSRPEIDRIITSKWLEKNGFPIAPLFMGKPQADKYVDDKAVKSLEEL